MSEHENAERMCEECGAKPAAYTVSVMMGDQVTQRSLCADCMAKMNMSLAAGNIKHLLSAIMSAMTGAGAQSKEAPDPSCEAEAPQEPAEDVVCESCGTTLSQFTRSGRLGCPGCYQTFRSQLQKMLEQIHGRVQHAGRQPLRSEKDQRTRTLYGELQRQLEQAVAVEDFETAAVLRDRIRAMTDGEAKA